MRTWLVAVALVAVTACEKPKEAPTKRVRINSLGGNRVEFVPSAGQLPYCHIFTRSSSGVLRQLTMTHDNDSLACPAGKPVGDVTFRIPVQEGEVTAFVLFSDQKLNAASVGQQLYDLPSAQAFNAMNLRVPGNVATEVLTFSPSKESETALGGVIGESGAIEAGDAGVAPEPAAAGDAPRGETDVAAPAPTP
jgi:hypothetical protein